MREHAARIAARAWRALLVAAVCALGLAALATALGMAPVSHAAGSIAWATAALGSLIGLAAGAGGEERT